MVLFAEESDSYGNETVPLGYLMQDGDYSGYFNQVGHRSFKTAT
jgi:hypothetical protein